MAISFSSSSSLIAVNSVVNIIMKGCSRFLHVSFFILLTADGRKLAVAIQFFYSLLVFHSCLGAVTPFARTFFLLNLLNLLIELRLLVEEVLFMFQPLVFILFNSFLQISNSVLEVFVFALCLLLKFFHLVVLLFVFLFTSLARLSLCFSFQVVLLSVLLVLSVIAFFALFDFLQVTKVSTVQRSSLRRCHRLPFFVRRPSYFFLFFSRHLLGFSHFKFKTNSAGSIDHLITKSMRLNTNRIIRCYHIKFSQY